MFLEHGLQSAQALSGFGRAVALAGEQRGGLRSSEPGHGSEPAQRWQILPVLQHPGLQVSIGLSKLLRAQLLQAPERRCLPTGRRWQVGGALTNLILNQPPAAELSHLSAGGCRILHQGFALLHYGLQQAAGRIT